MRLCHLSLVSKSRDQCLWVLWEVKWFSSTCQRSPEVKLQKKLVWNLKRLIGDLLKLEMLPRCTTCNQEELLKCTWGALLHYFKYVLYNNPAGKTTFTKRNMKYKTMNIGIRHKYDKNDNKYFFSHLVTVVTEMSTNSSATVRTFETKLLMI